MKKSERLKHKLSSLVKRREQLRSISNAAFRAKDGVMDPTAAVASKSAERTALLASKIDGMKRNLQSKLTRLGNLVAANKRLMVRLAELSSERVHADVAYLALAKEERALGDKVATLTKRHSSLLEARDTVREHMARLTAARDKHYSEAAAIQQYINDAMHNPEELLRLLPLVSMEEGEGEEEGGGEDEGSDPLAMAAAGHGPASLLQRTGWAATGSAGWTTVLTGVVQAKKRAAAANKAEMQEGPQGTAEDGTGSVAGSEASGRRSPGLPDPAPLPKIEERVLAGELLQAASQGMVDASRLPPRLQQWLASGTEAATAMQQALSQLAAKWYASARRRYLAVEAYEALLETQTMLLQAHVVHRVLKDASQRHESLTGEPTLRQLNADIGAVQEEEVQDEVDDLQPHAAPVPPGRVRPTTATSHGSRVTWSVAPDEEEQAPPPSQDSTSDMEDGFSRADDGGVGSRGVTMWDGASIELATDQLERQAAQTLSLQQQRGLLLQFQTVLIRMLRTLQGGGREDEEGKAAGPGHRDDAVMLDDDVVRVMVEAAPAAGGGGGAPHSQGRGRGDAEPPLHSLLDHLEAAHAASGFHATGVQLLQGKGEARHEGFGGGGTGFSLGVDLDGGNREPAPAPGSLVILDGKGTPLIKVSSRVTPEERAEMASLDSRITRMASHLGNLRQKETMLQQVTERVRTVRAWGVVYPVLVALYGYTDAVDEAVQAAGAQAVANREDQGTPAGTSRLTVMSAMASGRPSSAGSSAFGGPIALLPTVPSVSAMPSAGGLTTPQRPAAEEGSSEEDEYEDDYEEDGGYSDDGFSDGGGEVGGGPDRPPPILPPVRSDTGQGGFLAHHIAEGLRVPLPWSSDTLSLYLTETELTARELGAAPDALREAGLL